MIDPTRHRQLQELNQIEICTEILQNARNELYLNMRFLDVSLSRLGFEADVSCKNMGTDGRLIYYNPEYLMNLYRKGRNFVNRAYLHMVFHCLFCHMYRARQIESAVNGRTGSAGKGQREETGREQTKSAGKDGKNAGKNWTENIRKNPIEYWDLACDIAMEYLIDSLYQKCVHVPRSPVRREIYQRLEKTGRVLTGENIYKELLHMDMSERYLGSLKWEFRGDDHSYWLAEQPPKSAMEAQNRWNQNREKMQTEMETMGIKEAEDSRNLLEQLRVENRERYDYRSFLRRFAVLKEEIQVDMDSFDYGFYTYGMELYGNIPLLEPLESKEVSRIEDFVIVVDTSMSCSGELVKQFLEETYGVLAQTETYFRKVNVHILQCDEQVQEDAMITSLEEMNQYMENFTIKGHGGTDFRPAFQYVDGLMKQGRFKRLKGLIYFTDGKGVYPVKPTVYETAFVFLQNHYEDVSVPPWAIKLILDIDDLENERQT